MQICPRLHKLLDYDQAAARGGKMQRCAPIVCGRLQKQHGDEKSALRQEEGVMGNDSAAHNL